MLKVDNQVHLFKVLRFAQLKGKLQPLLDELFFLHTYANRDRDTPLHAPSNFHPFEVPWPPPDWAAWGGPNGERLVTCDLYSDSSPASFYFQLSVNSQRWMNGGLIYHGPQDGWELPNGTVIPVGYGVETFSVTLHNTPERPWQVHT